MIHTFCNFLPAYGLCEIDLFTFNTKINTEIKQTKITINAPAGTRFLL